MNEWNSGCFYSKSDVFVMRSQLDGHDPRLPGTGVFDIKTRAALPLRYDVLNYKVHCTLSTIVRLVGCVRLLLTLRLLTFILFFFHSRLLRWTPDSTPCALFLSFSFVLFIIVCCHVPLVLGPFTHAFFPLPNSPLPPSRPPPSVAPLSYILRNIPGTTSSERMAHSRPSNVNTTTSFGPHS